MWNVDSGRAEAWYYNETSIVILSRSAELTPKPVEG